MHKLVIKPWQEAREGLTLSSENVQIWSASLDMEDSSHYLHLLSSDEKMRAARLKSKTISDRQIISRGILRLLLGSYLGVKPEELAIGTGQFGKPFLFNPTDSAVCFNLAHSGNLALFAIGKGKSIGIDVEKTEKNRDFTGISSLVFSSAEQLSLSRSIDPLRDFYALWTAKEAILKASGRGFSYPSNQFSVVLSKGILALSKIPAELSNGYSCQISSFSPIPGYSAAIAILQ
jgi:4'-phosphopantetheinyl transferase